MIGNREIYGGRPNFLAVDIEAECNLLTVGIVMQVDRTISEGTITHIIHESYWLRQMATK